MNSTTATKATVSDATAASPQSRPLVWPLALPWLRVLLVALAALATAGILSLLGQPAGPEAVGTLSALYLLPVNVVTLWLVARLLRREGSSLRELIGFDRSRLGRDVAWGWLWLVVLWVPFMAAIMGTMFALYGGGMFEAFETVFAPESSHLPQWGFAASVVLAVLTVITFAPLNAPAEEVAYRGYAQGRLAKRMPVLAVILPSLAFGVQHIFFAQTTTGMLVYFVAFLAWGLGSALIFRWQGRLMPLIVAHLIVNLLTSLPALILPFVL
ncbi:MAG TPA: type II CAAX endopeptidase family protein [Terrimesophilobacter sp.]|nr:type II CAAX endopeptidase family protein [Terrimesophilobacter sp.]